VNNDTSMSNADDAEPSDDDQDVAEVGAKSAEGLAEVDEIGQGRRWYDFPYRLLASLQYSWPKNLLPRSTRDYLNYLLNLLVPYNEHERNVSLSREDPFHNVFVPMDEHVNIPGLWVVELFPPSEFDRLSAAIERNAWDRHRIRIGTGQANSEILERSRSGQGWTWWKLAEIAGANSGGWFPDGTHEKLPEEFGAIELTAIQIGAGLTAVMAYFHLSEDASRRVDQTWHADHEPQITRGHGRPKAEDRMWTSFRRTQGSRQELHDAARSWLAKRCPGFFEANGEPQLLLDLLLFDEYDPIPGTRADRQFSDALRALGVTGQDVLHRTSPDLPQMLLAPVEGDLCPALEGERTWMLFGRRDSVANSVQHLGMYGQGKNQALAHFVHRRIRNFLLLLAISEFIGVTQKGLSALRDEARTRHGRFGRRDLKQLRLNLLTVSLDLASVARDVSTFHHRRWRDEGDAQVSLDYSPSIVTQDAREGRKRFEPVDLNEELRKRQADEIVQLLAADKDYRDIVSTVASLGASIDVFTISRIAILVATASLSVALVTLVVSTTGGHAAFSGLDRWVSSVFGG
jgi:hypothetical protein